MNMQPDECFGPGAFVLCMTLTTKNPYLYIRPQHHRTGASKDRYGAALSARATGEGMPISSGIMRPPLGAERRAGAPHRGGCGSSDPMREAGETSTGHVTVCSVALCPSHRG